MNLPSNIEDDPEFPSTSTPFTQPPLPVLTSTPQIHPDSCLSLSTTLLQTITNFLSSSPHLTLSIGSGFGILEALLLSHTPTLDIIGIEVPPSPNKYRPPSRCLTVAGSHTLHPLATEARSWLFVYPRRVGLMEEYLREYAGGSVEVVVWAGPGRDWEDNEGLFGRRWEVEVWRGEEVGIRAYEVLAVARKIGR